MTYCVGMVLDEGLIFASDSRTNAGVDHVATFRKMNVISVPGERQIVPFGDFHIFLRLNSSTRASSGVMVAHFTPTPYCLIALAESTVILSFVSSRFSTERS